MANREHSELTGADLHAPGTHASQHKGDGSDPIANATTSVAGLESEADKTKLNGIASGATDDTTVNAHIADTSDAHDASAISFVPAGTVAATNVQAAIEEAASEGGGGGSDADTLDGHDSTYFATATSVSDHLGDTTDAHDASAISVLDAATQYTATNVEDALAEVLDALQAHEADSSDAHDASAISFSPTGTIAATDVQAAIAEVASEAGGGGSAIPVTVFSMAGNQAQNLLWTNMPSAETGFLGGTYRYYADLTNATQIRITVRVSTAGSTNAKLLVKYTTDPATSGAAFSYCDGADGPNVAVGTTGVKKSSWVNLAVGAKDDVILQVFGVDGDGAADPQFTAVAVQVK